MKTENPSGYLHQKHNFYSNANRFRMKQSETGLQENVRKSVITTNSAIKTTAGENPSGRLSFKGMPAGLKKVMIANAEGLAKSKTFNKFLDILADNTLVADALIALGLTTVLRPATIYAIPTKDPVEKKKNDYQVGHSAATGILGLGTTLAVAEPVKKAVNKIRKEPEVYSPKIASVIKKYDRAFKETAGRIHQPVFLPLRAALTIAIIPPILKMLGLEKQSAVLTPKDKAKIDYAFMSFKGNESKAFKQFAQDAVKPSKSGRTKRQNNNPSFKGLGANAIEVMAKGIGKAVDNNFFAKYFEKFANLKDWFPHLIAAESLWLSGFYMEETARSKSIKKDQKLPMILNQGITAALCTVGAYKLDGTIKKQLDKFAKIYKRVHPEMDEKTIGNKLLGIKLLGPIVIFTTIYRFIGPVVVTPIANRISEWIQPHKKESK